MSTNEQGSTRRESSRYVSFLWLLGSKCTGPSFANSVDPVTLRSYV